VVVVGAATVVVARNRNPVTVVGSIRRSKPVVVARSQNPVTVVGSIRRSKPVVA
jgi:hypothetical protein